VTPSVPTGLHYLGRVVKIRIGLPLLPKGMPPPGVRRVVMPSHAVPVTPPGMENGTPVH